MLYDGFEEEPVAWTFKVNGNGYIDIVIEGRIMDTLLELGEIENRQQLQQKVDYLLDHWKIAWKEKVTH